MKGGLERDEWGHPAVISLPFLPLLDQFPLFPPCVSPALLSFSFSQANHSNFSYVSLTYLPWHRTNEYSIAYHSCEHSVP